MEEAARAIPADSQLKPGAKLGLLRPEVAAGFAPVDFSERLESVNPLLILVFFFGVAGGTGACPALSPEDA
eukprot:5136021-Prymnesium_polylepis.1